MRSSTKGDTIPKLSYYDPITEEPTASRVPDHRNEFVALCKKGARNSSDFDHRSHNLLERPMLDASAWYVA